MTTDASIHRPSERNFVYYTTIVAGFVSEYLLRPNFSSVSVNLKYF